MRPLPSLDAVMPALSIFVNLLNQISDSHHLIMPSNNFSLDRGTSYPI